PVAAGSGADVLPLMADARRAHRHGVAAGLAAVVVPGERVVVAIALAAAASVQTAAAPHLAVRVGRARLEREAQVRHVDVVVGATSAAAPDELAGGAIAELRGGARGEREHGQRADQRADRDAS